MQLKSSSFTVVIVIMAVLCSLLSCDDKSPGMNCHPVIESLQSGDQDETLSLLNERLSHLEPRPVSLADPIGHEKNFDILIQELDRCESAFISLPCYGCIETAPLTSEMRVSWIGLPSDSAIHIDIRTPSDSTMRAVRIH